jgi:hypothetical protein
MSTLNKAIREDRTFQLADAQNHERKGYIRMWGNPRVMGRMGGGAGVDTPTFRMRCAFEPTDVPTEVRCVATMTFVDKNKRAANVREALSVAPGNTFHFVKLFRLAPVIGKQAQPWMFLLKVEEVE